MDRLVIRTWPSRRRGSPRELIHSTATRRRGRVRFADSQVQAARPGAATVAARVESLTDRLLVYTATVMAWPLT